MKGMIYRDLVDRYRVIEGGSSSHPLDWDTDTVSLCCRGSPMCGAALDLAGVRVKLCFAKTVNCC
jgi:hypothetical protein